MSEQLPPGLLEVCVVVGASSDRLREACQSVKEGSSQLPLLDPEVLHVVAPPFVSREHAGSEAYRSFGKGQRRRSFIKKKRRERPAAPPSDCGRAEGEREGPEEGGEWNGGVSVPKGIDLMALPQLCFPGGLQLTNEQAEERFHFLVFTDVFGNQTHGVVMQSYKPIQGGKGPCQNGHWSSSKPPKIYGAFAVCVISKHPYYNALKDCLSCLLVQLRTCRMSDLELRVKEFSAKLALVPIPPPGLLHVMFTLRPLTILLPCREDKDLPVVDLDLHLTLLCFRPPQLLQILCSILMEQRVVLFSSDWARLTLVAESLMLFLRPLTWQHPYVPVLSRGMLDFLMAPTAFLMGCHLSHYQEVAAETADLILINVDEGRVSSSCSERVNLPDVPQHASQCFTKRCQSLQLHLDLQLCHQSSSCDLSEQRSQKRAWQCDLNAAIQAVTLELMVNIFRDVNRHLNYEHRVFHSEEFLRSREPDDLPFYKMVLETHIFHSFLKDRLSRKMDAFTRMELHTRSESQRMKAVVEVPRRPTMQEIQARRSSLEVSLNTRLGMSLPNLGEERPLRLPPSSRPGGTVPQPADLLRTPPGATKVFKLPEFPAAVTLQTLHGYHCELLVQLGNAIFCAPPENSALLARYHYLRGVINTRCSKRLEALSDFQNLYKTDTAIFPAQLVTWLGEELQPGERAQAERRPELKRLLLKVKKESEKVVVQPEQQVKNFKLPRTHLQLDEFTRHVQESGIVTEQATIHRLFDALTVGQQKQVDPELFRMFYTFWKETEAEAQEVHLPALVIHHLDNSECVYKLSSRVKTSHGVGQIAMTQKRLFLLTDGLPGFVEITKFRDIEEVKMASAPLLLLRVPCLRVRSTKRKEVFEANLKTEADLWNLIVKEMWAGRKMADEHKDPHYMAQALTNVLLMDAVVGCLQNQRSIYAASKLAHLDRARHQVPMMVPKTTSEALKHKINPSLDLASPQAVHVLLYTPGQLSHSEGDGDARTPRLWVALSGGRVVVFDAASWSMLHSCIQVGTAPLNCMLGLEQEQVWIGSQDSVIYIIDARSMSCNKQLTEHRQEVTGFAIDRSSQAQPHSQLQVFSCSAEGSIIQWDTSSLQVRRQFQLPCNRLSSIQIHNGTLWCCTGDGVMELKKNGTPQRTMSLPEEQRSVPSSFSCFLVLLEWGQLWTGCSDSGELCLWHHKDPSRPIKRITLPDCSRITCMIRVKDQVWVGCRSGGSLGGEVAVRGKVFVLDPERLCVEKELQAHSDTVQSLCSAEDRYVLTGSTHLDGKIAIWKVE